MGSSCCAQCFRFLFALVNALSLIIGLALVGVGIYAIVSASNYEFISGSHYASGGIILIVSGAITSVIAGLGFVGACFKWRPLLVVYIILLTIIVILELAAGITGLVFKDKVYSTTESEYTSRLEDAMEKYVDGDSNSIKTIDSLQSNLQCCGASNYTDWIVQENVTVPSSCNCTAEGSNCISVTYTLDGVEVSQDVYESGCVDATLQYARQVAYVVGGVGIAFGIFEIIAILIAVGLVIWISKAKSDGYQVV